MEHIEQPISEMTTPHEEQDQPVQQQDSQQAPEQDSRQEPASTEHTFGRRRFLQGAGYGSLALAGGSLLAWGSQTSVAHAATQPAVLIHASDAVKPGELLSLNGEWLDPASAEVLVAVANGEKDDALLARAQQATIVQTDAQGHFVVARLPQNMRAGTLRAWVRTAAGTSAAFPVNQPRPLFLSEYEAWEGQEIKIVGRNFDPAEYGDHGRPRVRLVDSHGMQVEAHILDFNPYAITIQVPHAATGTYHLEVSVHGNQWWPLPTEESLTIVPVGHDPLGLGVAWADHFKWNQVFDVTKYGVPTTGTVDVTAQVQAVVDKAKAAGGGVVYFPAGKYEISVINLPAYIVLQGAGADKTTLISTNTGTGTNTALVNTSGDGITLGHQGVARLLMELKDDMVRPDAFMWLGETWEVFSAEKTIAERTASEMFVKEVHINYSLLPPTGVPPDGFPRGIGLEWFGKARVICDDNRFVGFHAQPYINFITDYASQKRNYFEYSTGGNIISTGGHTFIEDNMVIGHREFNGKWGDLHGPDSRNRSYFAHNTVKGMGTLDGGFNTIFNDGEAIWAEVAGSSNFNYGSVTAATATTLTLSPVVPLVEPIPYFAYPAVVIIDGRGLGQMRKVTGIDLPNNRLTIDRPWDVVPDTTSAFSLLAPNEQVTHYRNTIIDCTKGYYLFGNHFDAVDAENSSIDSEGYFLWAVRSAPNPPQKPVFTGFIPNYFVRFARNKSTGISIKSQHSGINYNLSRFDKGGAYFGTMAYGIEMVDNAISGNPNVTPVSGITEAAPYNGLAAIADTYSTLYNGDPGSGDGKNTVMARNQLTELVTAVTLTHAVYGTVVADNLYSPTVGTFLSDTGSANSVVVNNKQVPFSGFQTDLTGWTTVGGSWSEQQDGEHGAVASDYGFLLASLSETDFNYEGDLRVTANHPSGAGLVFRSQTNPADGAYGVNISTANGGQIELFKFPYVSLGVYKTPIVSDTTYHVKVAAFGSSLQVYLNNGTTAVIQTTDSTYAAGRFGLDVWQGSAVYQNIQVSPFNNFQTNLTNWTTVYGTWTSVAGGEQGTAASGSNAFFLSKQSGTNFTYEGDLLILDNKPTIAWLVFRCQADLYSGAYMVGVTPAYGEIVVLAKEPYSQLAVHQTSIALNTKYHVKIVANGSSLQVFWNGGTTPVIQVTDSSYSAGFFGLQVSNGSAVFQNIMLS